MASRLRKVDTLLVVGGEVFPVLKWSATLANQGSMGTAEAEGALSDLIASGLDIISASQDKNGAPLDLYAGFDGDLQHIFSGTVDQCSFDWDGDSFIVRGRDHSASLSDGKQTLAGMEYRNQKVTDIVRQIAEKFEFATEIEESDIKAGPYLNDENFFNPQPQTYWHLLQSLAESVGYECYMKPNQTLYFGPEKDQGSLTCDYGAPRDSDAENPGWGLKVDYNPRNNSNIVVKALSVNPQTTQKVTSTAKAKQVKVGKGRKVKSSQIGKEKKASYPKRGSSGSKAPSKSIYYIRCAGLSPEQSEKKCQAMADQLAKRQIIVEMSMEGNFDLKVHTKVTLKQNLIDLYGFDGVELNVSEVTHSFSTPGDGDSSGGLVSSFRATAQVESE